MYVPPHFVEARTEVLHDLIEKNPFESSLPTGRADSTLITSPSSCMRRKGRRACFIRMSLARTRFGKIFPRAKRR